VGRAGLISSIWPSLVAPKPTLEKPSNYIPDSLRRCLPGNSKGIERVGLLDPTPMVVACFLGESRRAKPECSLRKEAAARFKGLDEKESAGGGGGRS
jgi:hypothetical protein